MRLQLVSILCCLAFFSFAQENESVTVDFIQSYYEQDGNHSAVTGGEGTQAMFNIAQKMIVNVPLKNNNSVQVVEGISFFSSASSDNVNPYSISGASRQDTRIALDVTYSINDTSNTFVHAVSGGLSHEMHFLSSNVGYSYSNNVNTKNSFGINGRFLLDIWGQYYSLNYLYPIELRKKGELLPSNKRYSFQTGIYWQHILNKRTQMMWQIEGIHQFGLLSTPYHRVYFSDISTVDIERLPNYRFRFPITLKINHYASDWLTLKSTSRAYYDNFDIWSFSQEVKPIITFKNGFSFFPFYRIHLQTASKYFATYSESVSTNDFYTADFDLSQLTTHLTGAGVRWGKPDGLKSFKGLKKNKRNAVLRYIETRGMYYLRSDGLKAWMASFGFGFEFR